MITISAEGTGIERLAFEPLADVMSIPRQARPLEEVLQAIGDLPDGDVTLRSPYLEIKILMTEPEPSYKYKIEEALKGKAVRLARIAAMLPQKGKRHCRHFLRGVANHPSAGYGTGCL